MQSRWRLRSREDFQRLRQEGKTFRHPWVNLSIVANEQSHNRYGFITSKQLGGAVQRNRVRRRLRAVMAQRHESLKQGYDVLLIARVGILDQPFGLLQQAVAELLRRAGLDQESAT